MIKQHKGEHLIQNAYFIKWLSYSFNHSFVSQLVIYRSPIPKMVLLLPLFVVNGQIVIYKDFKVNKQASEK